MKKSKAGAKRRSKRVYREMTVALMRERNDAMEVAFSESARFYRLLRQNPKFDKIVEYLREAKEKNQAVRVLVDFPEGDVIEDAEAQADRGA